MKQTCSVVLALVLYASGASAQITGIAWDPSPSPGVTAYAATVDGVALPLTSGLSVPWKPSGAYHRICVASVANGVTGSPACIDYGTPPSPTPPPPVVSPDGTRAPPASSITRADGMVFTLGAAVPNKPGMFTILRDGVSDGGYGQYLVILGGVVYTLGEGNVCYSFTTQWNYLGSTSPCGTVAPPPPPAPQPAPSTFKVSPKICTLTDDKPDQRTGWGVQFRADGVNVGGRDTTAPYSRDLPYVPGSHVYEAIWTKTGVPTVTRTITTQGC